MSQNKIFKEALKARQSGKEPQAVFDEYKGQVQRDMPLALAIASVPTAERKAKYAWLNYILFAFLIFAAITKVLSAYYLFLAANAGVAAFALVLGVVLPILFAVLVWRCDGRAYPMLVLICVVNALNVGLKTELGSERWIDIGLLVLIAGLAFAVKKFMFPNIGVFRVKKAPNGEYAW